MTEYVVAILRKLAINRLLGEFFLLGTLLVVLPHSSWMATYSDAIRSSSIEFGKAFLIAAILGWAIDRALKQELVHEAVAAALGYMLPDRMKPELRWLIDNKIIATQSYDVVLEHDAAKRLVIFNGTVKRRIENFSNEKVEVVLGGGTEEWFSQHGESEIIAWTWKLIAKDEKNAPTNSIEPVASQLGIGNNESKKTIGPDDIIEVLMSYRLFLPEHSMEYLSYRHMIDRPSITVKAPPSLKVSVTFSHRDRYDEDVVSDNAVFSFTLERVLLPHQDIKVSWHLADDVEKRKQKHGLM